MKKLYTNNAYVVYGLVVKGKLFGRIMWTLYPRVHNIGDLVTFDCGEWTEYREQCNTPIGYLEDILNKFWADEKLQDAITKYGEWNGEELDKQFEITKKKIINNFKL